MATVSNALKSLSLTNTTDAVKCFNLFYFFTLLHLFVGASSRSRGQTCLLHLLCPSASRPEQMGRPLALV